jgi:hypothetical protein
MKRQKSGGRKKGTPNKVNKEVKELILAILKEESEDISMMLFLLSPKERLDFFIKLLPYVCTKQKRNVEVNGDLSDFEITIDGDRQTLLNLLNQEKRVKKLEKDYKAFRDK